MAFPFPVFFERSNEEVTVLAARLVPLHQESYTRR